MLIFMSLNCQYILLFFFKIMRYLFLLIFTLFSCQNKTESTDNTEAKEVLSMDFEQLSAYMKPQGDTLYVFNFWATWCESCVEELPYFEMVNQDYKNKPFKMILVSLDFKKHFEDRLLPFVEKNNLKAQVIHLNAPNANEWINQIDTEWSGAIPATLIYNQNKRLFFEQSFNLDELKSTLSNF